MSYRFNFGVPGFMDVLTDDQRDQIDAIGVPLRYADKQHMQSRGDTDKGFSVIKSGAVCFGKTDSDGRFLAVAVLEAGQCYGEFTVFAGLPRTHDAYAQGDTVVSHISKARFDRLLLERPDFAAPIIRLQTIRLHYALEWADDLRRYPLRLRLGKHLMIMLASQEDRLIKVTQTELAELMGVSRMAISKVLQEYRAMGFVRVLYGGLEMCDTAGLRRWLDQFVRIDPVSLDGAAADVRGLIPN